MRVEREMDAGPVALQREISIGEYENHGDLSSRLAALTADALEETIEQIAGNQVVWTPQEARQATVAPKIERADRLLIWSEPADALVRRVHAMAPTPGRTMNIRSTSTYSSPVFSSGGLRGGTGPSEAISGTTSMA